MNYYLLMICFRIKTQIFKNQEIRFNEFKNPRITRIDLTKKKTLHDYMLCVKDCEIYVYSLQPINNCV